MDSYFIYKNNGDIFVFGNNSYGQLIFSFDKDSYSNKTNTSKHPKCHIEFPILLMNNKTIKNISCFGFHNIIYKDNGDILVLGNNNKGQLGLSHNIDINIPTLLMNDKTVKNIISGGWHTIIHKDNGDIFVFGYNEHGQLGLGHNRDINVPTLLMNNKNIKKIICGSSYTIIYNNNGEVFVWI